MYSLDNVLLTEFYIQRRTHTPLAQIPPHVGQAIIAIEDTRFYQHIGEGESGSEAALPIWIEFMKGVRVQ